MSTNKTTILEHNERLSTLVETVENLPDAPKGELTITENGTHDVKAYESVAVNVAGSGESVKTCSVTLLLDSPPFDDMYVYYTNENMDIVSIPYQETIITVVKNTILVTGWSSEAIHTGECEQIFYYTGKVAYKINGDCTLLYR